jgi:hypothetical protein
MVNYYTKQVKDLEDNLRNPETPAALKRQIEIELADQRGKLSQAKEGTSFKDFAVMVANREEIKQILDRDAAERHYAQSYGQPDWKKNSSEVRLHAEGLVAFELARPLRVRTSVESVGLVQVVYPGIKGLDLPIKIEETLPIKVRKTIANIWPDFVALLLDTVRRDGCVGWSSSSPDRTWLDESPLDGRWLTRNHSGWSAHAFVGAKSKQLRRQFALNVLKEAGYPADKAEDMSRIVLEAVFDQLFQLVQTTEDSCRCSSTKDTTK